MGLFADHRCGKRNEGDQPQQDQIDEQQAAIVAADEAKAATRPASATRARKAKTTV
jgi:hypothetical protein